ncbi:trans-1,2-dihydrobenzene-1,2-diol dehydrogenase-like [Condylostylus longicornis]|uniref:trans-1,2-dihydrobenzene-1,2-diol dehydrogenase-like n=1 Tax=Condylostylus longicornis TaxID=2530218 RepID=UPI00244DCF8E|nr:trans-1,2-dihydrobenzene-1,2-diol dehydrogenase-like [Condylostylus longicornis]
MALKWGIASAGKISYDFAVALSTLPEDEHSIVAVAARDQKRAEDFAKNFDIPKSYNSYEQLANDPEIQIVYIGAIHPHHYDIGIMMLENNKHILCEKPLCMNEKQAKKLITYAERKKLFLMEAVWSRFFPAYQYIRKQINTGLLGDIEQVDVQFGFDLTTADRVQKKELGGGCILDIGIYTIQISQWAFQQPPKSIEAKGELNSEGVDIEVNAKIHYSDKTFSNIKFSGKEALTNTAVIKGSKASITLKNFWCPTTIIDIDGKEKTWVLPESKYKTNYINSVGLRYEAEEARKCILEGKIQSDHMNHNESLLLAHIEDEFRKQVGVTYKEDE